MNISEALKTDIALVGDFQRTPGGDLGRISGLANLKQALLNRLLTVPGTLMHRPSYGAGITLYEGAPNSFSIQQKIASLIQEQFSLDPRVQEVTSVNISSTDDTPQSLTIAVFIKAVGYTETEMVFTPFNEGKL